MGEDFWMGVAAPFLVVGGLIVVGGLLWLALITIPEGIWWTVKRLRLHEAFKRDQAAALVSSARRAYTLRIPMGVRITLTLGENREGSAEMLDALREARRSRVP
ncbi:hypothetical protein [Micromonospora sp. WMMD737]|uniref:hypothetical protein n=1 Tax=Micromonospora sp. WMMD737 TaxID=3404113 RepID=UPI003B927ED9